MQSDRGDNSWKSRLTCYKCGKQGHITRECCEKEEKQDQMHMTIKEKQDARKEDPDHGENIFVQKKEGGVINKNWVLLDSQSTVNQVSNPALLSNIRRAKNPSIIRCNAGSTSSILKGEFGSVMVKHSPHGIANVLSLNEVKQRHRVMYNSHD